jgi:hypothetical protein
MGLPLLSAQAVLEVTIVYKLCSKNISRHWKVWRDTVHLWDTLIL